MAFPDLDTKRLYVGRQSYSANNSHAPTCLIPTPSYYSLNSHPPFSIAFSNIYHMGFNYICIDHNTFGSSGGYCMSDVSVEHKRRWRRMAQDTCFVMYKDSFCTIWPFSYSLKHVLLFGSQIPIKLLKCMNHTT